MSLISASNLHRPKENLAKVMLRILDLRSLAQSQLAAILRASPGSVNVIDTIGLIICVCAVLATIAGALVWPLHKTTVSQILTYVGTSSIALGCFAIMWGFLRHQIASEQAFKEESLPKLRRILDKLQVLFGRAMAESQSVSNLKVELRDIKLQLEVSSHQIREKNWLLDARLV